MKKIILIFSSLIYCVSLSSQDIDLDQRRWQDRVILIFAESPDDTLIQQQLTLLQEEESGLKDRELVIYQFFLNYGIDPNGKNINFSQKSAFLQKFNVRSGTFAFILIGKDGGEKLRSSDLVSTERLFEKIDAMPMRRAEMRRKKNKSNHNEG